MERKANTPEALFSNYLQEKHNITIKKDTKKPGRAWKRFRLAEARRNLKEC